jgi:hypothetical protein
MAPAIAVAMAVSSCRWRAHSSLNRAPRASDLWSIFRSSLASTASIRRSL